MKNRKLQWLLIPLVLILWGIIGYQIYSGVKGEAPVVVKPKMKSIEVRASSDTLFYALQSDYPDPFLKNQRRYIRSGNSGKSTTSKKAAKPKVKATVKLKPLKWPTLTYRGQLEKKTDKIPMCIIEIDKSLHFMHQGEEQAGVKLLKVSIDSVRVEFKAREKKTLYR